MDGELGFEGREDIDRKMETVRAGSTTEEIGTREMNLEEAWLFENMA